MTRLSCGSKVRYDSVPEAMRALEEAKLTWGYPPVRWYECNGHNGCGGYHLTAQPHKEEIGRERAQLISLETRARARASKNPLGAALDKAQRGGQR